MWLSPLARQAARLRRFREVAGACLPPQYLERARATREGRPLSAGPADWRAVSTCCLGIDHDDNGIEYNKNRLRFPYDPTFLQSHDLHPHPYHDDVTTTTPMARQSSIRMYETMCAARSVAVGRNAATDGGGVPLAGWLWARVMSQRPAAAAAAAGELRYAVDDAGEKGGAGAAEAVALQPRRGDGLLAAWLQSKHVPAASSLALLECCAERPAWRDEPEMLAFLEGLLLDQGGAAQPRGGGPNPLCVGGVSTRPTHGLDTPHPWSRHAPPIPRRPRRQL
jgi:hypothetical protein